MTVSVIIPTLNRPATLSATLETLLDQTRVPDELVIVDHSADFETRLLIESVTNTLSAAHLSKPLIRYLFQANLIGAGAARNLGIRASTGEVLVFLDDDVLLEPSFLAELLAVYDRDPEAGGVSGVVTNYSRPPLRGRLFDALFCIGPFYDERQAIYWDANALLNAPPIPVRKFGAGLMSLKRSALGHERFDDHYPGAGPEDVDLSWRVSERCRLLITPLARLIHLRTDSGRPREDWFRYAVAGHHYLYHRLWRTGVWNRLCFIWLNVGYTLMAARLSIRRRSLSPIVALAAEVRKAERLRTRT